MEDEGPAETAKGADLVMMSLPMPHHVEAVCTGDQCVIDTISPGDVVVNLSTNSVSMVRQLHKEFATRKGIQFLDSPVNGGVKRAIGRDLCIMAGGDKQTYQKVKPVLDPVGDKVMYCGPIGNGTMCKLANQLLGSMIGQSVGEVLTMGVKAGVRLQTLVDAISRSSGGNPLDGWESGKVKDDFEPDSLTFYLELLRKDVRLALELGRQVDVPMEIGNIVEQRFLAAPAAIHRIVRLIQEERANVDPSEA